jgi:hypothetical protein
LLPLDPALPALGVQIQAEARATLFIKVETVPSVKAPSAQAAVAGVALAPRLRELVPPTFRERLRSLVAGREETEKIQALGMVPRVAGRVVVEVELEEPQQDPKLSAEPAHLVSSF